MLQKIPKNITQYIKSQQYIIDTYTIVKELVENAIDASASAIKVIILEDFIIVEDNGVGIEDLEEVCKSGFTSKEDTTYKVLGLHSYSTGFSHGFRGQALSSINELCDVEITSRTRNSSLAKCKNFPIGVITEKPREPGTTVKVSNLFKNCLIRRNTNQKLMRKSISKIILLLRSFLYVNDTHFTLIFKNQPIFSEKGSSNTKEFSIEKHGTENLQVEDEKFSFYLFPFDKSNTEIVLIEKRSCKYEKAQTLIKSIFKQFFPYLPTYVLVLKDECDINISADKSEIILKNCKYVENKIKSEMMRYFTLKSFIHGSLICDSVIESTIESADKLETNETACHQDLANSTNSFLNFNKELINMNNQNGISGNNSNNNYVAPNETPASVICQSINDHSCQCTTLQCRFHTDNHILNSQSFPKEQTNSTFTNQISTTAYKFIREEALSHSNIVFEKEDFKKIKIIGQFNQGFILGSLEKNGKKIFLVVDQHAANEIYNFEILQKTFKLKKQQLLQPINLNLSALQQLTVEDNIDAFLQNGFDVRENKLYSIPVYHGKIFTVDDFYSLLANVSNEVYISDKFREIMASKACRSSVMIGDSLTFKEMQNILNDLCSLNSPWTCPHGRPTFKILCEY